MLLHCVTDFLSMQQHTHVTAVCVEFPGPTCLLHVNTSCQTVIVGLSARTISRCFCSCFASLADKLPAVRRGFFGCVAPSSFSEPSEAARVPYAQGSQAVVNLAEVANVPGNAAAVIK
jgi:hypothetical protein